MTRKAIAACVLIALGTAGAPLTTTAAQSGTTNLGSPKADTQAIDKLQQAAQRLRDAVQQLSKQQAGDRRNYAMKQANEALLQVKQAMGTLPPEYRSKDAPATGSASREVPRGSTGRGSVTQGEGVDRLLEAAQRLRESVQAMAAEPPGERRNTAIRAANEALFDTESALAAAIGPNRSGAGAAKGGSGS